MEHGHKHTFERYDGPMSSQNPGGDNELDTITLDHPLRVTWKNGQITNFPDLPVSRLANLLYEANEGDGVRVEIWDGEHYKLVL